MDGETLEDPLREALRVIDLADRRGLVVRLLGGLAFHAQAPDWSARVERPGRDIDLAIRARDGGPVTRLLEEAGYVPDQRQNALYGHKQLYFMDPARRRPVDVLLDRLDMCHTLDFADRLGAHPRTLPLAELLLTKLQIVRLNRKDALDALALLSEHPIAEHDDARHDAGHDAVAGEPAGIDAAVLAELTARDWGWWRTVTGNLDRLRAFVHDELAPADLDMGRPPRYDLPTQLKTLRAAIDDRPKTMKWKLRARVGDRVQWYEDPEELDHER